MKKIRRIILSCLFGCIFTFPVFAQNAYVEIDNIKKEIKTTDAAETKQEAKDSSKTISANFVDADIKQILSMFARQSGVNIIVSPEVKGKITIGLRELPLEEALKSVLMAAGLTYQMVGNTYVVMPSDAQPKGFFPLSPSDKAKKGTITLNVKEADLSYILETISTQTGIDVIMFGAIHEKLTVRIKNMPFEDALRRILSGTKYSYRKDGNLFIIGDSSNLAGTASALVTTRTFRLNYLKAKDTLLLLPPTIIPTNLKVNEYDNSLIVTGPIEIMDQMEKFLKDVDIANKQVVLETSVLELNQTGSKQLGLSYSGNLTANISAKTDPFQIIYDDTKSNVPQMQITLNALLESGDAQIRANPRVAATNGKEAFINVGKTINVKVTTGTQLAPVTSLQTISAGITLKMTPYIGNQGDITLDISTEVSSITGIGTEGLPEISSRKSQTTIRVKDNQPIIIGGLIQNSDLGSEGKIPILGDLPIIGSLFGVQKRKTEESELVIIITPHILKEGVILTSPLETIIPKGIKQ